MQLSPVQIRRWESLPGFADLVVRTYKTVAQWVAVAEKLATEHDGVLPSLNWLRNNGYKGLASCVVAHPTFFTHITQDSTGRTYKTVAQWVSIADKLSTEHNGVLPKSQWLRNNGYSGLVDYCIEAHPEAFAHIKRAEEDLGTFADNPLDSSWVTVPEFPQYAVNRSGEVMKCQSGRILRTFEGTVVLCRNGKACGRSVRRLMTQTFPELYPPKVSRKKRVPRTPAWPTPLDGEAWARVADFPQYAISSQSRVVNINTGQRLQGKKGWVSFSRGGKSYSRKVKDVVARIFGTVEQISSKINK
jgi:hypothetical protein